MSVGVVIAILRELVLCYRMNEDLEKKLYAKKSLLDKALSNICNYGNSDSSEDIKQAVSNIDIEFYELINDDKEKLQGFLCKLIKKHCENINDL